MVISRTSPRRLSASIVKSSSIKSTNTTVAAMSSTPLVHATRVVNQAMKLQIPRGLSAGDTFIVTPDNGRVFTVIVPENAVAGSYIEVIVPDEVEPLTVNSSSAQNDPVITVQKTTAGAALAGALVGTLLLGPIVGILLAGGAAYAT